MLAVKTCDENIWFARSQSDAVLEVPAVAVVAKDQNVQEAIFRDTVY